MANEDNSSTGDGPAIPPVIKSAPAPAPIGDTIQLRHPDGIGCSFDGVSYEPAEDGSVTVPLEANAVLASLGFAGV